MSLRRKNKVSKVDFQSKGALYLPKKARCTYLLDLTESENIGKEVNETREQLKPKIQNWPTSCQKTYASFENDYSGLF